MQDNLITDSIAAVTIGGGVRTDKRGRGAEGKQLIAIAAEFSGKKKIGRIRIQRSPGASAEELEGFIKKKYRAKVDCPHRRLAWIQWRGWSWVQTSAAKGGASRSR